MLVSATTFIPRLVTVIFWISISKTCCSTPAFIEDKLQFIDAHDYKGIPFATTLYKVLFDSSRPARTSKALLLLETRLKGRHVVLAYITWYALHWPALHDLHYVAYTTKLSSPNLS